MIRISVMYPAPPGSHFDWDYYLGAHLQLAKKLLSSRGLVRIEIDKGLGGFPPGAPAPYHAVGHLFFRSMEEMERALEATAAEFIADARKYSSERGVVQINEVVEI